MMKEGYPLFPYFDYKEWGDVSKGIYPKHLLPAILKRLCRISKTESDYS